MVLIFVLCQLPCLFVFWIIKSFSFSSGPHISLQFESISTKTWHAKSSETGDVERLISILTWFYSSHKPLVFYFQCFQHLFFLLRSFSFWNVSLQIFTSALPHCWRFELAKPVIYICLGPALFNSRSNKVSEQRQAAAGFTSFWFLHCHGEETQQSISMYFQLSMLSGFCQTSKNSRWNLVFWFHPFTCFSFSNPPPLWRSSVQSEIIWFALTPCSLAVLSWCIWR